MSKSPRIQIIPEDFDEPANENILPINEKLKMFSTDWESASNSYCEKAWKI